MLNRGLLLAGGKAGGNQTVGEAGGQGFGVGVYGGDPADLTFMGLTPMDGCDDPSSDNYGNYQHTNGSVMCFIPAFCYRIGNTAAPSYARDKENALEIRDASEGEGNGWILHRAFIDGGRQKLGFFIDKYICSKDSTGNLAVSVKNGDNLSLYSSKQTSGGMPNCTGNLADAIVLGRARGEHYSCVTAFQWSAISMLSLAHGQAATSNQFCGWYDAGHVKNFPKGNNNKSLSDINDSSVKWAPHSGQALLGKTGSGSPFNKTTHNGQNNGVTDVNGSQWQAVIGWRNPSGAQVMLMKESVKAHGITKDNRNDTTLYDVAKISYGDGSYYWGANAFFTDESGVNRALCGIHPRVAQSSSTSLFGDDDINMSRLSDEVLIVGGNCNGGADSGVWCRSYFSWAYKFLYCSFRVAGYAS